MRLVIVVSLTCVLALGCRLGYRSVGSSASAVGGPSAMPVGAGTGVKRSLAFSDEGGILSRAGLAAVGVAMAGGAVENRQSTTSVNNVGDRTIVTTTNTGTINTNTAQGAANVVNAAADPKTKLSGAGGGLAANLEIAARTLGGDTSGWQYDMGYAFRKVRRTSLFVAGYRGYLGLGYGTFTTHPYPVRMDRGPPQLTDEVEHKFLGMPTRFGVFLTSTLAGKRGFGALGSLFGTETFVKLNLNASGPTMFHVGQRLQWALFFVEVEVLMSSEDGAARSYGIEFGIGI